MQLSEIFTDSPTTGLAEAKQVGVLYHFTGLYKASQIIEDDTLRPKAGGGMHASSGMFIIDRYRNWVSLTRNPTLIATVAAGGDDRPWGEVRIAFDGDVLSQRHKIEPYHDQDDHLTRQDNQAEERIIGTASNIRSAILQVDIDAERFLADQTDWEKWVSPPDEETQQRYAQMARDDLALMVKLIRDKGIPCNLVRDFRRPVREAWRYPEDRHGPNDWERLRLKAMRRQR